MSVYLVVINVIRLFAFGSFRTGVGFIFDMTLHDVLRRILWSRRTHCGPEHQPLTLCAPGSPLGSTVSTLPFPTTPLLLGNTVEGLVGVGVKVLLKEWLFLT